MIVIALVIAYAFATFRPTRQVKVASGVYNLWVADTDTARIKGLSGVSHLPPGGGLFMDFQADDTWGIWMKDMKIPLDIVWLNKAKQVVYIVKDVSPNLGTSKIFQPSQPARYVLELPQGTVDAAGIKMGGIAQFSGGSAG